MKKFGWFLVLVIGAGVAAYVYSPSAKQIADEFIDDIFDMGSDSILDPVVDNKDISKKKSKGKAVKKIRKTVANGPYDQLDEIAKNTSSSNEQTMEALVAYLASKGNTELNKTRLIFTWIATNVKYDDKSYNSGNYADMSAGSVFKRRSGVCEGYSNLFQEMCTLAGIKAEKVIGYSKGYGYSVGDHFTETTHAWNVVKTDGKWGLYDVTWARGYGETVREKLKSVVKFDDYWFNVKPEEFLFTHFPENNKVLFTANKYHLSDFETLPHAYKSFFKLGFSAQKAIKFNGQGKAKEFAATYSYAYPVRVVKAPYVKQLPNNREYEIIIESEYMEDIQIINEGNWIPFEKNGSTFTVKVKPQVGTMKISTKVHSWEKSYNTAIEYEVVDAEAI